MSWNKNWKIYIFPPSLLFRQTATGARHRYVLGLTRDVFAVTRISSHVLYYDMSSFEEGRWYNGPNLSCSVCCCVCLFVAPSSLLCRKLMSLFVLLFIVISDSSNWSFPCHPLHPDVHNSSFFCNLQKVLVQNHTENVPETLLLRTLSNEIYLKLSLKHVHCLNWSAGCCYAEQTTARLFISRRASIIRNSIYPVDAWSNMYPLGLRVRVSSCRSCALAYIVQ